MIRKLVFLVFCCFSFFMYQIYDIYVCMYMGINMFEIVWTQCVLCPFGQELQTPKYWLVLVLVVILVVLTVAIVTMTTVSTWSNWSQHIHKHTQTEVVLQRHQTRSKLSNDVSYTGSVDGTKWQFQQEWKQSEKNTQFFIEPNHAFVGDSHFCNVREFVNVSMCHLIINYLTTSNDWVQKLK